MEKSTALGLLFLISTLSGCGERGNGENPTNTTPIEVNHSTGYDSTYIAITSGDYLQDKLFYLATLLQNRNYQGIEEQPEFRSLRERYISLLLQASEASSLPTVTRKQFLISEKGSVASGFARAYRSDTTLQKLVRSELVRSGNWELSYSGTADTIFLKRVVLQTAAAVDTIISQYLLGTTPKYPEDGPSDSNGPKNVYAEEYVMEVVDSLDKIDRTNQSPLYLPIQTALALLRLNNRDEAARFEPLSSRENKAALDYLKNIVWANFTYASLIVPGDSPNSSGDAINLSESAKKHVQYAAEAYNEQLAPVIIISGANVYPYYPPHSVLRSY